MRKISISFNYNKIRHFFLYSFNFKIDLSPILYFIIYVSKLIYFIPNKLSSSGIKTDNFFAPFYNENLSFLIN